MADNDLESLVHLEQTFYDAGYTDGFAHGRIHGLIEGRALGRHHGFTIWEEMGFYEGFARAWQAIYGMRGQGDQRAVHHMTHLLDLVGQFPTVNPSSPSSPSPSFSSPSPSSSHAPDPPDLAHLQRQIRSRYKALCACLGVRPTLRASTSVDDPDVVAAGEAEERPDDTDGTRSKAGRRAVWTLEGARRPTVQGLSF